MNNDSARKKAEGFKSWTNKHRSQGQGRTTIQRSTFSDGVVLKNDTSKSLSSELVGSQRVPHTDDGSKVDAHAANWRGMQARSQPDVQRHFPNAPVDGRSIVNAGKGTLPANQTSQGSMHKFRGSRASEFSVKTGESSGLQKSKNYISTTLGEKVSGDSVTESHARHAIFAEDQDSMEVIRARSIPSAEWNNLGGTQQRKFPLRKRSSHLSEHHFMDEAAVHEEDISKEAPDEEDMEVGEVRQQSPVHGYGKKREFFSSVYEEEIENGISENEDEGRGLMRLHEHNVSDTEMALDWKEKIAKEESTRRTERRRERTSWLREGDRRKREGRPRNYLLVDECTGKPYGTGVGEWRKELMLLSRELDPAIGNINQQPEGVLFEIADWIQHTWEYSSPVKFKFVKEVIARGVTLRRRELWTKIENGEDKPPKVSDRTWRTLERLLQSPATIKKFEDCSRANASRVNFGRTGPSREVGVRERLRRRYRRSPEPEEIRLEMARDKGFGGRSKRKISQQSVMLGKDSENLMGRKVAPMNVQTPAANNVENDDNVANKDKQDSVEGNEHSWKERRGGGREYGVMHLTEEDIAQHPFVLKMIERLKALEGQESAPPGTRSNMGIEGVSASEEQGKLPTVQEGNGVGVEEGDTHSLEVEPPRDQCMTGRVRKKS